VGSEDIFPEEFERFLGLSPELKAVFLEHHRDLLNRTFWVDIQHRLIAGQLFHVPPYDASKRLPRALVNV